MLTDTQKSTLKTYILAQPDLAAMASGEGTDYAGISNALNANASPTKLAWIVLADIITIDEAPSYTSFDTLAAGKRDSWVQFLQFPRNFVKAKVRNWIVDIWGAAIAGSNSEAILQAGTEKASRAEVALGGTDKTTGTVTALDRNWTGDVSIEDVAQILA